MSRRQFIRLLGGGTVAAATLSLGGCITSDLPSQAVEAWKGRQANETALDETASSFPLTAIHKI